MIVRLFVGLIESGIGKQREEVSGGLGCVAGVLGECDSVASGANA